MAVGKVANFFHIRSKGATHAIQLTSLGGAHDTKTKLMGAGSSTTKATCDTADTRFLNFNLDCGAPSGDNRGIYLALALTGGAGGEAARFFTSVNESAGTAHGAHISLNFALTKALSGQGIAARCTLHIPNDTSPTGTLAAVQAEAYCDGTSSDPAGAAHGLFRAIVDGGDATAQAKFKNFMLATLPSGAYNSGNMYVTTNDATFTEGLRCVINGAVRYIGVFTSPIAP